MFAALYVHVPFCRCLCPYCPYNKVRHEPDLATRYHRALRAEIRRSGDRYGKLEIS